MDVLDWRSELHEPDDGIGSWKLAAFIKTKLAALSSAHRSSKDIQRDTNKDILLFTGLLGGFPYSLYQMSTQKTEIGVLASSERGHDNGISQLTVL